MTDENITLTVSDMSDPEVERWIKDVVIPRYKRYKENPGVLIPLEEVEQRLEQSRKRRAVAAR